MIEKPQKTVVLSPAKLKRKVSFYKLARALGTNSSTLYSWTDRVPEWRIPPILSYCRANGIDISDCYEVV